MLKDRFLAKNQVIRIPGNNPEATSTLGTNGSMKSVVIKEQLFQADGQLYRGIKEIDYDHIPSIVYTQPALYTFKNFDLKTEGKLVGYIPGAGDKVPEALQAMGYKVVTLSRNRYKPGQFKAV